MKIKTDKTWEAALVQADAFRDQADDAAADYWLAVGSIQRELTELWERFGKGFWTLTHLSTAPEWMRTKSARFSSAGADTILQVTFCRREVSLLLAVRDDNGNRTGRDGRKFRATRFTTLRRTTIAKHGTAAALRGAAERLAASLTQPAAA